jgi:hypothetical protein
MSPDACPRPQPHVHLRRRALGSPDLVELHGLWHGSARAGDLLVAAADRADSAAERCAAALLRTAGITGWVLGHPFGKYRAALAARGDR